MSADEQLDRDCFGEPRDPDVDGPCPGCDDGPGPGQEEEDVTAIGVRRPVSVPMVGADGNAYAILGRVTAALRAAGAAREAVGRWVEDATSGTYGHLLAAVVAAVEVDRPCDGCGAEGVATFGCDGLGWACAVCSLECGCSWCEEVAP